MTLERLFSCPLVQTTPNPSYSGGETITFPKHLLLRRGNNYFRGSLFRLTAFFAGAFF